MTPSIDPALSSFETSIDRSLADSHLWRMPRHLVLGLILNRIRDLELGSIDPTGTAIRPRAAASLIDRLPALVPYIARTELDYNGGISTSGISGSFSIIAVAEAMSWAHAAELYPDLRHGWRAITASLAEDTEGNPVSNYLVSLQDGHAPHWEVRDIILARLASPWGVYGIPSFAEAVASALDVAGIPVGPHAAPILALRALGSLRVAEFRLVDDHAMQHMVGVTNDEFDRFRDSCTALGIAFAVAATHCMDRARESDLGAESNGTAETTGGDNDNQWFHDARSWALPTESAAEVSDWLTALSGLDPSQVDRLIGAFSEPHTAAGWPGEPGQQVDGFFAPFWPLGKGGVSQLLLSPWHLQSAVTRHSLLSRYARLDPKGFDNVVSRSLEPELMRITIPLWESLRGVVVVANKNWSVGTKRGEFDTLIYEPETNTVVHVQAKASLQSVSARMLSRMEKTVEKGLEQLRSVRDLTSDQRDQILSNTLGTPVSDPTILDVLMTTGGVGSAHSWSLLHDVTPLNPTLLNASIESALSAPAPSLALVIDHAVELLDGLIEDANPVWSEQTVALGLASDVGPVTVAFPALQIDLQKVARFRSLAWPS